MSSAIEKVWKDDVMRTYRASLRSKWTRDTPTKPNHLFLWIEQSSNIATEISKNACNARIKKRKEHPVDANNDLMEEYWEQVVGSSAALRNAKKMRAEAKSETEKGAKIVETGKEYNDSNERHVNNQESDTMD